MPSETVLQKERSSLAQLTDEAFADVLSKFPHDDLTRVRGFLDNLSGRSKPVFHKHQSTELGSCHFPGLPDAPYPDPSLFFEVPELESAFDAIREEARQLVDGRVQMIQFGEKWKHREHNEVITESEWPKWKRLPFYNGYTRRDENCANFPVTSGIIDRLVPQYDDFDHSTFLIHDGKMRLEPHIDIFNLYVSLWLPIFVPADCGLEVAGQRRTLTEGKCIAFDNSYLHSTWNNSDQPRVVFSICRITPLITHAEAAAYKYIKNTYGPRFNARANTTA